MTKATDLRQAINLFDPENELRTPEDLAAFYIPRPESPLQRLHLLFETATEPQKILFTGHRGSGKSTELTQLAAGLSHQFLVVHYSAKRILNLFDLTYVDVLLSLGLELIKVATEQKLKIDKDVLAQILDFTKDISHDTETNVSANPEVGVELNLLAVKLSSKLSSEAVTRTTVRERVEHRISDLIFQISLLSKEVRSQAGREVLFIVEDLDKTDLVTARRLFFNYGPTLLEPRASIIYTFPIALRHENDFMQVEASFSHVYVLPNFKPRLKDKTENEEGMDRLRAILTHRIDSTLIRRDALDYLAECSGGIPRELVVLAREATLEALIAGRTEITLADAEKAASRKRADYQVLLSQRQLELLKDVHLNKRLDNTADHRALLHNLSALEYRNDDVWYDVHPLVVPLL
jgi:hypothetical protein